MHFILCRSDVVSVRVRNCDYGIIMLKSKQCSIVLDWYVCVFNFHLSDKQTRGEREGGEVEIKEHLFSL